MVSIDAAIARFIERAQTRGVRPDTVKYYQQHLRNFQTFTASVGLNDLQQIQAEHIDSYIAWMAKKGNKPRTINAHLRAARALLNWLFDYGYLDRQIKIKLVKVEQEMIKTFGEEEIGKLIEPPRKDANFVELRDWAMICTLLQTGMRRSTLRNLRVSDIDFDRDEIRLRHTKNRRQQVIPLQLTHRRVLRRYLQSRNDWHEDDFLFCTKTMEQLKPRSVEDRIKLYCKSRGIDPDGVGCHIFRHSFARLALVRGIDLLTLQKVLGHSSLDMTQKYANLLVGDIKQKFDSRFDLLRTAN